VVVLVERTYCCRQEMIHSLENYQGYSCSGYIHCSLAHVYVWNPYRFSPNLPRFWRYTIGCGTACDKRDPDGVRADTEKDAYRSLRSMYSIHCDNRQYGQQQLHHSRALDKHAYRNRHMQWHSTVLWVGERVPGVGCGGGRVG
jgi:hypothetical protein